MALNIKGRVVGLDESIQDIVNRVNRRGLSVKIRASDYTQPLGRITQKADEFSKSLEASNARVIAFGASAAIIGSVATAFSQVVIQAIKVEKLLTDINVVLGTSLPNLEKFGRDLFDVARNTSQGLEIAAEAALEFSRQGLSMEETLRRTNDALILTRLTGIDAAAAVSGLTAAVNGFADAGLTTTSIINKLAAVDVKFAVSADDLINALARSGAVAQDAGVSFDQLVGAVTSAQQITARGGAVIGNSFKTIFTRIQRSSTLDRLEELGVAVRDIRGNTLPALTVLTSLSKTYDTLGSSTKAAVAEQVGGVFQINVLKAALKDLNRENSLYAQATNISASATDQAQQKNAQLQQTISSLAKQTSLTIQELSANIGELALAPGISNILDAINSAGGALNDLFGSDSESLGSDFAKGLVRGIGSVLTGPGLVVAFGIFGKLFFNALKFAKSSLKDILGIVSAKDKERKIQESIVMALGNNKQLALELNKYAGDKLKQEQIMLGVIADQTKFLERQAQLAASLAPGLLRSGVTPGLTQSKPKTASSGLIPKDSSVSNMEAVVESGGAKQAGYKPGKIKKTKIKGVGDVVYNDAETVKKFDGFSQEAILPPQKSQAGKQYQSTFQDKHGFDPYKFDGLIPNFIDPRTRSQKINDTLNDPANKGIKFKNKKAGKSINFQLNNSNERRFVETFLKQKLGSGSLYLDRLSKVNGYSQDQLDKLRTLRSKYQSGHSVSLNGTPVYYGGYIPNFANEATIIPGTNILQLPKAKMQVETSVADYRGNKKTGLHKLEAPVSTVAGHIKSQQKELLALQQSGVNVLSRDVFFSSYDNPQNRKDRKVSAIGETENFSKGKKGRRAPSTKAVGDKYDKAINKKYTGALGYKMTHDQAKVDQIGKGLTPIESKYNKIEQANLIAKSIRLYSDKSISDFLRRRGLTKEGQSFQQENFSDSLNVLSQSGIDTESLSLKEQAKLIKQYNLSSGLIPNFVKDYRKIKSSLNNSSTIDDFLKASGLTKLQASHIFLSGSKESNSFIRNLGFDSMKESGKYTIDPSLSSATKFFNQIQKQKTNPKEKQLITPFSKNLDKIALDAGKSEHEKLKQKYKPLTTSYNYKNAYSKLQSKQYKSIDEYAKDVNIPKNYLNESQLFNKNAPLHPGLTYHLNEKEIKNFQKKINELNNLGSGQGKQFIKGNAFEKYIVEEAFNKSYSKDSKPFDLENISSQSSDPKLRKLFDIQGPYTYGDTIWSQNDYGHGPAKILKKIMNQGLFNFSRFKQPKSKARPVAMKGKSASNSTKTYSFNYGTKIADMIGMPDQRRGKKIGKHVVTENKNKLTSDSREGPSAKIKPALGERIPDGSKIAFTYARDYVNVGDQAASILDQIKDGGAEPNIKEKLKELNASGGLIPNFANLNLYRGQSKSRSTIDKPTIGKNMPSFSGVKTPEDVVKIIQNFAKSHVSGPMSGYRDIGESNNVMPSGATSFSTSKTVAKNFAGSITPGQPVTDGQVLSKTVPEKNVFNKKKLLRILSKGADPKKGYYPKVEEFKKAMASGAIQEWAKKNGGVYLNVAGRRNDPSLLKHYKTEYGRKEYDFYDKQMNQIVPQSDIGRNPNGTNQISPREREVMQIFNRGLIPNFAPNVFAKRSFAYRRDGGKDWYTGLGGTGNHMNQFVKWLETNKKLPPQQMQKLKGQFTKDKDSYEKSYRDQYKSVKSGNSSSSSRRGLYGTKATSGRPLPGEQKMNLNITDPNTKLFIKKDKMEALINEWKNSPEVRSDLMFLNRGLIPNFANPLAESIAREKSAGISESMIRVDQDDSLKSRLNPMGLAVTNTRDEPAGVKQGIQRAREMGIDPKTHGASSGLIPNFGDESGPAKIGKIKFKQGVPEDVQNEYIQSKEAINNLTKSANEGSDATTDLTGRLFGLTTITYMLEGAFSDMEGTTGQVVKTFTGIAQGASQAALTFEALSPMASGLSDKLTKWGSSLQGTSGFLGKSKGVMGTFVKSLGGAAKSLPLIGSVVAGVIPIFSALKENTEWFDSGLDTLNKSAKKTAKSIEAVGSAMEATTSVQETQKQITDLTNSGQANTYQGQMKLMSLNSTLIKNQNALQQSAVTLAKELNLSGDELQAMTSGTAQGMEKLQEAMTKLTIRQAVTAAATSMERKDSLGLVSKDFGTLADSRFTGEFGAGGMKYRRKSNEEIFQENFDRKDRINFRSGALNLSNTMNIAGVEKQDALGQMSKFQRMNNGDNGKDLDLMESYANEIADVNQPLSEFVLQLMASGKGAEHIRTTLSLINPIYQKIANEGEKISKENEIQASISKEVNAQKRKLLNAISLQATMANNNLKLLKDEQNYAIQRMNHQAKLTESLGFLSEGTENNEKIAIEQKKIDNEYLNKKKKANDEAVAAQNKLAADLFAGSKKNTGMNFSTLKGDYEKNIYKDSNMQETKDLSKPHFLAGTQTVKASENPEEAFQGNLKKLQKQLTDAGMSELSAKLKGVRSAEEANARSLDYLKNLNDSAEKSKQLSKLQEMNVVSSEGLNSKLESINQSKDEQLRVANKEKSMAENNLGQLRKEFQLNKNGVGAARQRVDRYNELKKFLAIQGGMQQEVNKAMLEEVDAVIINGQISKEVNGFKRSYLQNSDYISKLTESLAVTLDEEYTNELEALAKQRARIAAEEKNTKLQELAAQTIQERIRNERSGFGKKMRDSNTETNTKFEVDPDTGKTFFEGKADLNLTEVTNAGKELAAQFAADKTAGVHLQETLNTMDEEGRSWVKSVNDFQQRLDDNDFATKAKQSTITEYGNVVGKSQAREGMLKKITRDDFSGTSSPDIQNELVGLTGFQVQAKGATEDLITETNNLTDQHKANIQFKKYEAEASRSMTEESINFSKSLIEARARLDSNDFGKKALEKIELDNISTQGESQAISKKREVITDSESPFQGMTGFQAESKVKFDQLINESGNLTEQFKADREAGVHLQESLNSITKESQDLEKTIADIRVKLAEGHFANIGLMQSDLSTSEADQRLQTIQGKSRVIESGANTGLTGWEAENEAVRTNLTADMEELKGKQGVYASQGNTLKTAEIDVEIAKKQKEMNIELGKETLFRDTITERIKENNLALEKFGETMANTTFDAVENGFKDLVKNMGDGTKSMSDSFLQFAGGIASSISNALTERAAKQITSGIFDLMDGFGGKYQGGLIQGYASGGTVGNSNKVPSMLTSGEYVVKKKIVDRLGVSALDNINESGSLDDLFNQPNQESFDVSTEGAGPMPILTPMSDGGLMAKSLLQSNSSQSNSDENSAIPNSIFETDNADYSSPINRLSGSIDKLDSTVLKLNQGSWVSRAWDKTKNALSSKGSDSALTKIAKGGGTLVGQSFANKEDREPEEYSGPEAPKAYQRLNTKSALDIDPTGNMMSARFRKKDDYSKQYGEYLLAKYQYDVDKKNQKVQEKAQMLGNLTTGLAMSFGANMLSKGFNKVTTAYKSDKAADNLNALSKMSNEDLTPVDNAKKTKSIQYLLDKDTYKNYNFSKEGLQSELSSLQQCSGGVCSVVDGNYSGGLISHSSPSSSAYSYYNRGGSVNTTSSSNPYSYFNQGGSVIDSQSNDSRQSLFNQGGSVSSSYSSNNPHSYFNQGGSTSNSRSNSSRQSFFNQGGSVSNNYSSNNPHSYFNQGGSVFNTDSSRSPYSNFNQGGSVSSHSINKYSQFNNGGSVFNSHEDNSKQSRYHNSKNSNANQSFNSYAGNSRNQSVINSMSSYNNQSAFTNLPKSNNPFSAPRDGDRSNNVSSINRNTINSHSNMNLSRPINNVSYQNQNSSFDNKSNYFRDQSYQNKTMHMSKGGKVHGPGGIDKVGPVMLDKGEYVVKASSVQKVEKKYPGFFNKLNTIKMNQGGIVDSPESKKTETVNTQSENQTNSSNVTVNINVSPNGSVSTEGGGPNEQEFASRIKDAVVNVISQEQKIGGVLSGI